ncbi:RES domain-containing protein (plasmid) [Bosea vestrisii]|uniref:RES domain-containing protein n=1 Tax=Bosea vestrisii TaxID=151416 RepID=UPI0024E03F85|nr:RES domain-containing protein [Bosea vestrisii]WID99969.1 RES domain-containing protein [Bosea vestrisii]
MGFGQTRFSSPDRAFRLVYIARDLATAIAETIVRDRFEGGVDPVLWTPWKSFSGVSDAAFSKCLSAGVPATDGGVGPIRANA